MRFEYFHRIIMKLSIITVNLNNREGLRKTAESILDQTFTDYEWIVVDGASTDGSVEVANEFAQKINAKSSASSNIDSTSTIIFSPNEASSSNNPLTPTALVISEPDTGIYNAMNKGIKLANGAYCLFLNSGDWLYNEKTLFNVFDVNRTSEILFGDIIMQNPNGLSQEKRFENNISLEYIACEGLCHNSTFIDTVILKQKPYNEDYKIVSDRLNFILWALCGYSFERIPFVVSNVDMTGISSTNRKLLNSEIKSLIEEHIPSTIIEDFRIIHENNYYKHFLTKQVLHFAQIRERSLVFRKMTNLLLKMFK